MNRELAQAVRCQLLTGSFEGREDGCECTGPLECFIDESRREVLCKHETVIQKTELNRLLFNQLQKEQTDEQAR